MQTREMVNKDAISVLGTRGVPPREVLRLVNFIGNLRCLYLTFMSKCETWKMKDLLSLWLI